MDKGAVYLHHRFMTPLSMYQSLLTQRKLHEDADQQAAVEHMQRVFDLLNEFPAVWQPFGRYHKWSYMPEKRPNGFYFYGTVGRGKSMLMNLFYECVTQPKRRVHFHTFMDEVHDRMNERQTVGKEDPVHLIAESIAEQAQVLCFDEFYITNIADAMMLGRLFEKLVACGVVICSTSNWAPEDLFLDGSNRVLFKPFIKKIQQVFDIISLGNGTDWRRKDGDLLPHVYVGNGHDLKSKFLDFSSHTSLDDTAINVIDATLHALSHSPTVLHMSFKELCAAHVAAEHYLSLAHQYHTFMIEGIPMLDATKQDAAMRFVILIDILYENGNALVLQSKKALEELCVEGESAFAFERTISRIIEMQRRL